MFSIKKKHIYHLHSLLQKVAIIKFFMVVQMEYTILIKNKLLNEFPQ